MYIYAFGTGAAVGAIFGVLNILITKYLHERKKVHGKHFSRFHD
jgi:hypothetical protein